MKAESIIRSKTIVWCCTCDGEVDIGPLNHLSEHPDHYVVEAHGTFWVWRNTERVTNDG